MEQDKGLLERWGYLSKHMKKGKTSISYEEGALFLMDNPPGISTLIMNPPIIGPGRSEFFQEYTPKIKLLCERLRTKMMSPSPSSASTSSPGSRPNTPGSPHSHHSPNSPESPTDKDIDLIERSSRGSAISADGENDTNSIIAELTGSLPNSPGSVESPAPGTPETPQSPESPPPLPDPFSPLTAIRDGTPKRKSSEVVHFISATRPIKQDSMHHLQYENQLGHLSDISFKI